jgi:hypothetical protein
MVVLNTSASRQGLAGDSPEVWVFMLGEQGVALELSPVSSDDYRLND